jgi:hypothetical protein
MTGKQGEVAVAAESAMQNSPIRRETVEQLRSAIDSGRTGDKIPYPDPAAAPLGGDEEAAGTPLSRERVSMAMQAELQQRTSMRRRDASGVGAGWILMGVVAVLLLAMLGWGATLL